MRRNGMQVAGSKEEQGGSVGRGYGVKLDEFVSELEGKIRAYA